MQVNNRIPHYPLVNIDNNISNLQYMYILPKNEINLLKGLTANGEKVITTQLIGFCSIGGAYFVDNPILKIVFFVSTCFLLYYTFKIMDSLHFLSKYNVQYKINELLIEENEKLENARKKLIPYFKTQFASGTELGQLLPRELWEVIHDFYMRTLSKDKVPVYTCTYKQNI